LASTQVAVTTQEVQANAKLPPTNHPAYEDDVLLLVKWLNSGTCTPSPLSAAFTVNPGTSNSCTSGSGSICNCPRAKACSFVASVSSGGAVTYVWDWGDGTPLSQSTNPTPPPHTYASSQTFVVTLEVTDSNLSDAVFARARVRVTSKAATPSFTASCSQLSCIFNGTGSEAGDASIINYSWNFGDANSDPSDSVTSHTFSGAGSYDVTLTVTDSYGVMATAAQTITIVAPPMPNFTANCVGMICSFDASSTTSDSPIASYSWAFGDESTDTTSAPTDTHTYSKAGTYTVTLTVTDSNGETGTISAPVSTGLIAGFTFSCSNMTCSFYSTAVGPLTLTTWTWSFGDGTVVTNPGTVYWDPVYTYAASGQYTVTLTVTDVAGNTAVASLVVLADIAPIAANDSANTPRDTPATIDVLANDSDANGDPLTIANVTLLATYPGAAYQVIELASGRWGLLVTPPNAFVGTLTFTYQACDPWGECSAPATVTLTVKSSVLDAIGEQFYTQQNQTLYISVAELLANVYVAQPTTQLPLTISYDKSILSGSLSCTSTTCTYTPNIGEAGYTLFRYTVTDYIGNQDTAPVRIYVGLTDNGKVTSSDIYLTNTWDTPLTFTYNDVAFQVATDTLGDTLTIGLASQKTLFGNLVCSTPMYTCTYTPNTGYAGTDRFAYTATDMINPPVTAYLNILTMPLTTPTFDARGGVVVTGENEPVYIGSGILANDYLPNGGPEVVTAFSTTGLQGTLSCTASGCTYTPPYSGFQGTTSFTYTATDSHGATDTAAVKICVACTNHAPVAAPQALTAIENTPLTFSVFNLMKNNYDPDDDPLFLTVFTVTAKLGTLNCGTPNYWCTYTPNANTTGSDVITYELSDGQAYVESTVTVTINPPGQ
jgi:PKD repeat protein